LGYEINKNEMGWVCGTYGREERCVKGFCWGDLKERGHMEDLSVYNNIIIIESIIRSRNIGCP
jgi:hypothetical protein